MFTGVALIFDTYRNNEHPFHKDIIAVVNNGSFTASDMMTNAAKAHNADGNTACDSSFRYHVKRNDFSVTDKTVARIKIAKNVLTLDIDAKNKGIFKSCLTRSLDELPGDFMKGAYIGLTASTGHLADNHDVISLKVSFF